MPLKLYCLCSVSHRPLAEQWFLPSLKDPYLLQLDSDPSAGTGNYKDSSWNRAIHKKVSLILRALRENPGEVFLFSDVDIQFFRKTEPWVLTLMARCDLAVLQDSPQGTLGTGFFACRSNAKTIRLWRDVQMEMALFPEKHDQEALNDLWFRRARAPLRILWKIVSFLSRFVWLQGPMRSLLLFLKPHLGSSYGVRLRYFPPSFFSPGIQTEKIWAKGDRLGVPGDIVLHHANWTCGIENKISQLELVRDRVLAQPSERTLCHAES